MRSPLLLSQDFPDTNSYWPKTVALLAVEDDYGLGREIAGLSIGVVGPIKQLECPLWVKSGRKTNPE